MITLKANGDIENKFKVTKGERRRGRDKLGVWDEQVYATV